MIHFEVAVLHPEFNNSLNIFNPGRQHVRKDIGFARGFGVFMAGGPMPPDMQQIWAPNPGRLYRPPRLGGGRYYVPNRFTRW
jgi:hypothetical protein